VADPCPEDAWAEGATAAFAVFALEATPVGSHVVFAVDRRSSEVTHVRILDLTADSVRGWDAGLLPSCSATEPSGKDLQLSGPSDDYS
jgi:hypothetical protein